MEKWFREVESSLAEAINASDGGTVPLQNLYMLAPIFYSKRHNMNNEALLRKMIEASDAQVAEDISHDPRSIEQYKFHYVSCYLYCLVVAGKFDEFQYDRVMEYVNERMNLFSDDYDFEQST
jgi:hypothetical protein